MCEGLSSSDCDTSGISACQTWGTKSGEQKAIGGLDFEVEALSGSSKTGISVIQKGIKDSSSCPPNGNYVQVDIECDPGKVGDLQLSYDGYFTCKYQFKGKHANACKGAGGGGGGAGAPAKKKGLSIGSIILIVALVCSVIYLAAGVGWQYRKGERGVVGLLPHKGFWSSIPGLVKEGVLFSYTSIRARFSNDNYHNIT